jgi:2-phosphosulfolactate phosphatase
MSVDVFFCAREVDEPMVEGRVTVVIDVIRATSTMLEALANGARSVFPTASTEEAIKLASSLGRDDTILCGERKGLKIEGFDLGNSPTDFTSEVVNAKQLVMTTTNGTQAFLVAEPAQRVLAASFMNLSAVGEVLSRETDPAIICAGRRGGFALDDALCAGMLLKYLEENGNGELVLNDAARVARRLAEAYRPDETFLRSTDAGRALELIDMGPDLVLCADLDRHALVPEMRDRRISLPGVRPAE